MKDVQLSVGEVDRTKIIYFTEESDAIDLTAKSDVADARAKGKKKDVISIFSSRTALKNKVSEDVIIAPISKTLKNVSFVMCHLSPITCHLSPVTCHLPCFAFFLSYVS